MVVGFANILLPDISELATSKPSSENLCIQISRQSNGSCYDSLIVILGAGFSTNFARGA